MCNVYAIGTETKRGDGAHVELAFTEGKKRGIFVDGDVIVTVHTKRNIDNVKQWMIRILTVTSSKPL